MEENLKKEVLKGPEKQEDGKIKVAMCLPCVFANEELFKNNTLPFLCPRTEMPCLAIKPEYLDSKTKFNDLILKIGPSGKIPIDHECLDQEFIQTMREQFATLVAAE